MKKGKGTDGNGGAAGTSNVTSLAEHKARKAVRNRTPWANRSRQGTRNALLDALVEKANREGLALTELSSRLGVTYGYIAQLRSGLRRTEHISDMFAKACALYLGVPTLTVKMLAGRVSLEDFVMPAQLEAEQLELGLKRITEDPLLAGFFPSALWDADASIKRFALMLYSEASGLDLLAVRKLPEIVEAAQKAAATVSRKGAAGRGSK